MTDTRVGGASVELSADANKFTAGISAARKSLRDLGGDAKNATKAASDSIDRYVKRLEVQAATIGKSAREQELYKLSLRGATREQLASADAALRMTEAYARGERIGQALRRGTLLVGTAIASFTAALSVGVSVLDSYIDKAAQFQDGAEKIGDTAENLASLSKAAIASGFGVDALIGASVRLTKNLTGVDDEAKAAGAAISALGLNLKEFKALSSAEQIETLARALDGFADTNDKTAVTVALLGKSGADALPFLKELIAQGGRQVILTQEQIKAADDYADRNAALRAELELYAQVVATRTIPVTSALLEAFGDAVTELLGLRNGISDLANDNKIVAFAERSARGLAVIADAAFLVGRSIGALGDLIGGSAAATAQLVQGNFRAAQEIARATAQTLKDTQFALGLSKSLDARLLGQAAKFKDPRILGPVGSIEEQSRALGITKPRLTFTGPQKSGDGDAKKASREADQEARAQLAFELNMIRTQSSAIISEYSNRERILDAQRSAGLVSERAYYAEKISLTKANFAEEERATLAEIARLQKQTLTGKEKIDNDRRIAALEADLAVRRASATASETVLTLQQVSALDKLAKAEKEVYQNRLDSLLSGTPSEVFRQQAEDLEFLQKALANGDIKLQQYTEAVRELFALTKENSEKSKSMAEELGLSFSSAFEDAIVSGKAFSDVLRGLEQDILRIVTRRLVTEPLANAIGGAFDGGGSLGIGGALGKLVSGLFSADGGGFTGSGPRTGGLDGKGGFLGMLHPQETVVDHTKGQRTGVVNQYVTINPPPGMSRQASNQFAAEVARQMRLADARNN